MTLEMVISIMSDSTIKWNKDIFKKCAIFVIILFKKRNKIHKKKQKNAHTNTHRSKNKDVSKKCLNWK